MSVSTHNTLITHAETRPHTRKLTQARKRAVIKGKGCLSFEFHDHRQSPLMGHCRRSQCDLCISTWWGFACMCSSSQYECKWWKCQVEMITPHKCCDVEGSKLIQADLSEKQNCLSKNLFIALIDDHIVYRRLKRLLQAVETPANVCWFFTSHCRKMLPMPCMGGYGWRVYPVRSRTVLTVDMV